MNAFRSSAMVALALVGSAAAAGAQGKCEINTGSPFQVQSARIYLNKAAGTTGSADEKPKHLMSGVKVLTEKSDKIGNQLGRHYLLARILYQWTRQERQPLITTRGQLGYTDNPSAPIDLLAAIDTSLSYVEGANPACRDSTTPYRRALFTTIYAKGVEALNAEQLDSAEYHLKRSLVITPANPAPYNALAIVAQKRNDEPGMITYYSKVIELAGSDTMYASAKKQALQNLGILKINQAEAATGAEKTRLLRESETMFRGFLAQNPSDPGAQQGLARVLNALGDTAAIAQIYSGMLANPQNYTDIQLFEAGSAALRAKQPRLGEQLLAAGLEKNPYYRDGLYNLATAYFDTDNVEKLEPVVKRLVTVDPNNADNWRLYAGQFQIRQQQAQKAKKTAPKWVTDSLLLYIQKFQGMTTQVSFTSFSHSGAKHELTGSVINSGSKPVEGTLEIEFLDAKGEVVAKKTTPISVPASSSADFKVDVVQSGIVAYRYKPIG